jgi:hypothetical protein
LDQGARIDVIIDFSKAFDLFHFRVDSRVVMWVREFLLGHLQKVRVGGQLSEKVRVMSGVPHGSELGPHLFLAYVDDIWGNIESTVRLFTDDCIIYRKIMDGRDI